MGQGDVSYAVCMFMLKLEFEVYIHAEKSMPFVFNFILS